MATGPVLRVEDLAKSFGKPGRRADPKTRRGASKPELPDSALRDARPANGQLQDGLPGSERLRVFSGLSFAVNAGEMVAIVGESGSGKSSLLHLLAMLDRPDQGAIWFGGQDLTRLGVEAAAGLRNREIGYVWQFHYLLPEFTAVENVALPLLARGMPRAEALKQAREWLESVGLGGREEHRSGELSGGEQQRVAIARALVTRPRLLLADEPTGDLDDRTAERVFALIQRFTVEHGLATVLVTHSPAFAKRCEQTLRLQAGRFAPAQAE